MPEQEVPGHVPSEVEATDNDMAEIPLGSSEIPNAVGTSSVIYGLASDVGRRRDLNEDSAFALTQHWMSSQGAQTLGLFILADGMGGHTGGERASLAAVGAASEALIRDVVLQFSDQGGNGGRMPPLQEAMAGAFEAAQRRVQIEAPGGATTLTIAFLIARRVYVGHVGDCRLYLWRGGELTAWTRDHSVLSRLIELGQVDSAEADSLPGDPRRNALYRAVGQSGELEVDFFSRALDPGDGLLLCSDGLWSTVPCATLAHILASAETPKVACRQMIDVANEAGGPDNITAIFICPVG
jgi:PPM family protein phosphatase